MAQKQWSFVLFIVIVITTYYCKNVAINGVNVLHSVYYFCFDSESFSDMSNYPGGSRVLPITIESSMNRI